ncbi:MAG: hypothetical protein IEMM0008_0538 [bacterium]|nr:MAG: hypothetical protein IEMM0008_0538 [bacterium]
MTTIKGLVKKNAPGTKVTNDAGITIFDGGGKNQQLYAVEKDAYLFFAMSSKGNGKSLIQSVLSGKSSLTDSKSFKDIAEHIDSSQDFFAFADMKKITSSNMDLIKKSLSDLSLMFLDVDMTRFLGYLKDYEGIGLNIDLKSSDFLADLVVNINPSSGLLKLDKNITYNKKTVLGISEPAALFISTGINVSESYKMLVTKPVQDEVESISKEYGINVEKDIIENIAGDFNLCSYDGSSLSKRNYNTIFTISVKDEGKVKEVISKIRKKLPPMYASFITEEKVGSVNAYHINAFVVQIYMGLKDGNLIITSSKPMFEKAIKGDPSKGFLTKLDDKNLVKSLSGKSESIFYINVDEVFKALKNFGMLAEFGGSQGEKVNDMVKQFKYLLISSKTIENSATSHFVIKTKFNKSFLEGIKDIKDSFKLLGGLEKGTESISVPQLDGLKDADRVEPNRKPVIQDAKGQSKKPVPMKQPKKAIKN